jgi:hypothetical protein
MSPSPRITVVIVNHVGIDIACSPEAVWAVLHAEYVEARKFSDLGYTVEPIADPAFHLGGYRLRYEQDGTVVDERVCRITEIDAAAHRLGMAADCLSVPGGMSVFAGYSAQPNGPGTHYAIDCHSRLAIDSPGDGSRAAVAAAVTVMTGHYAAALLDQLQRTKAALEAR